MLVGAYSWWSCFQVSVQASALHPILAFVLSRSISRFISCAFQFYLFIFFVYLQVLNFLLFLCILIMVSSYDLLIGRRLKRWRYLSILNLQYLNFLIELRTFSLICNILETLPSNGHEYAIDCWISSIVYSRNVDLLRSILIATLTGQPLPKNFNTQPYHPI